MRITNHRRWLHVVWYVESVMRVMVEKEVVNRELSSCQGKVKDIVILTIAE